MRRGSSLSALCVASAAYDVFSTQQQPERGCWHCLCEVNSGFPWLPASQALTYLQRGAHRAAVKANSQAIRHAPFGAAPEASRSSITGLAVDSLHLSCSPSYLKQTVLISAHPCRVCDDSSKQSAPSEVSLLVAHGDYILLARLAGHSTNTYGLLQGNCCHLYHS